MIDCCRPWALLLVLAQFEAQSSLAEDARERGFAHFYFVANPARSPKVQEPHLYSKTMRRLESPLIRPVYRLKGSEFWTILDADCSPEPLPLNDRYTEQCLRHSGWRMSTDDGIGVEWLPDIVPAKHLRFVVLASDQRSVRYEPRPFGKAELHIRTGLNSDDELLERLNRITANLMNQSLHGGFNLDTGHCYVLAALIKRAIEKDFPNARIRFVHIWAPEATRPESALKLARVPDRKKFLGRQSEIPVPFRYHTALSIEGADQVYIIDPTAADSVVDLNHWEKLFVAGSDRAIEFVDQAHFQLDLSAHLSVTLTRVLRLKTLIPERLDATDWVSLLDVEPTPLWPQYIIQGHDPSGRPDRTEFTAPK
jgi:hypothetical protein